MHLIFYFSVFMLMHVSAHVCHLQGAFVYLISYLYTCVCRGYKLHDGQKPVVSNPVHLQYP
jgi:hypothetical protein